ncbi:virulence protein [Parvularcula bermudensis HTCC2503]|uniref:Virulence protein n=1 Tax=Parvularcula bermudensis (strain ATCC BAA-594 / HTCC2503 / KCTC 12087) TaxID=314260 RepID=E0THF8_PARBH|nr:virulence protein [Parvularcula bermudensis]ADM10750.1 virulence protein [Parvularcula bermudensis HTCC2503]
MRTDFLIVSGDGAIPYFSWGLAKALRSTGGNTHVIGAFWHFLKRRTPEGFARYLEQRLSSFRERGASVQLVGYSFGAVLVHSVPHFSDSVLRQISRVTLIAPAERAGFRFHPAGWWGGHGPDDQPTDPAIANLARMGVSVQVIVGSDDAEQHAGRRLAEIDYVTLPGGHTLRADYAAIATQLTRPLSR